jgi:hypothetical protein
MPAMVDGKPLSPKQAAARLGIAVPDLPRTGLWTRQQVHDLQSERPGWLTQARREYCRKDDEAARARQEVEARPAGFSCFCCKAMFAFTIDSGGLCEACNEGECPSCGGQDWLHG